MSFTEKIVVGKISVKVMHSGKVMCMAFPENSFKVMWGCDNKKSYAGIQIRFAPGSQVRREEEQGSEASILFA